MKKYHYKTKRAESLVEVIIAIFVVAMGAGITSSLVVSALQSNSFSRDNLIALNLAVEGLEAVRDIRDSNWLKFSFDRKTCWDLMPSQTECNENSKRIETKNYTTYLGSDYTWQLKEAGTAMNLDATNPDNNNYVLNLRSDGNQSIPIEIYSSNSDENQNPKQFNVPDNRNPFSGRFYRMIQIKRTDDPNVPGQSNIDVTSIVQWKAQNVVHNVTLSSLLTNYQM